MLILLDILQDILLELQCGTGTNNPHVALVIFSHAMILTAIAGEFIVQWARNFDSGVNGNYSFF